MQEAERSKRYDLPLSSLDYEYIKKCKDVKELEKIVKVLRSGEEGNFPDLNEFAEEHLRNLAPNSRVLRKAEPVKSAKDLDKNQFEELTGDLANWENEMKTMEHKLTRSTIVEGNLADSKDIPPVRGRKNINLQGKKKQEASKKANKSVKPRDYREWDKVDIDAELAKVDQTDDKDEGKKKASGTSFNTKMQHIPERVDTSDLNEEEKHIKAEREKDKGNEAFRSGDYQEALLYYERSLSIISTVAATNNRAQCYIKLQKWDEAIKDCNAVLKYEKENLKALLRRGVAYHGKKLYSNAKNDLRRVLVKEPNNKRAKDVLEEVERAIADQKTTGRRMLIEETDGSSSESDEYEDAQEGDDATPLTNGYSGSQHVPSKSVTGHEREVKGCSPTSTTENLSNNHGQSSSDIETNSGAADVKLSTEARKKGESDLPPKSDTDSNVSLPQSTEENSKVLPPAAEPQLPLPPVVLKWKEEGGNLFKSGQYGEAAEIYTKAIAKLHSHSKGHRANLAVLYSNRAACQNKIGASSACVKDCDAALELAPGSLKPLLRRAQAQEGLERYGKAYIDYKQALHIGGTNEVVHQGLTRCQNNLQSQHGHRWRDKLPPMPDLSFISCPFPPSASSQQTSSPVGSSVLQTAPPPPKAPSPEEEFEMMKDKGNSFVKAGKFTDAAVCYGRCIQHVPQRPVSYTNRALCYLRLNKPELVIEDCNIALDLEPSNIKALFRRGQAYKMRALYAEAMQDLESVIELDSKNSAAKRELSLVKKYKEEEDKKAAEKRKQRVMIKEVDSSDDSDEEADEPDQTKPEKEGPITKVESPSSSPVKHKDPRPADVAEPKSPEKKSTMSSADSPRTTCSKASIPSTPQAAAAAAPHVPSAKTPYEFVQAWSSMKLSQGPEAYIKLLEQVEPQDLAKVISNKLDGAMLAMFIQCMHNLIATGQASRALAYLQNLTTVPRFQMVTMFMGPKEKDDLNLVLKELEEQANCEILLKDLDKLRKQYSL